MVSRIWEMNAERIRSGRPETISAGEQLELPA
jgi:hypothetical protein